MESKRDSLKNWVSFHIYCSNSDQNIILLKVIRPATQKMMAVGLIRSFFFIRYFDGEHHIRLRLLANGNREAKVLEIISTFLENLRPKLSQVFKVLPIGYQPEIARYGGSEGILLAERQFHISSTQILKLVKINRVYEDYLGYAIPLHVSFGVSAGLTLIELVKLFETIFLISFPYANRKLGSKFAKEFEVLYQDQRANLIHIVSAVVNRKSAFPINLKEWIKLNKGICRGYDRLDQRNKIVEDSSFAWGTTGIDIPRKQLIYISFIHMTNNRLGIANNDESYLAYLIKRSLSELPK